MMRIDAMWLCSAPQDMRMGGERLLAKAVEVFGAAQAHHAYLFANARATRMKLVMHDGFGLWCAVRRLNTGRLNWPSAQAATWQLSRQQFEALMVGLPWQRLESMRAITHL